MITDPAPPPLEIERIPSSEQLRWFPDHLARYLFALQWAPGARVLDVCCGVGYGSLLLAAAGAVSVEGLDISEDAIHEARKRTLPNLRFRIGDACQPYGAEYELITCFEGIEHVGEPKRLLQQICASLRPGGLAVISTPNQAVSTEGASGNPYHLSEMTDRQFRAVVGQFPFDVEWYAQIGNNRSSRPAWLRRMIRTLRLRQLRRQSRTDGRSQPQVRVLPEWPQPTDLWYPIRHDHAERVVYQPPPNILLAVCRKAALIRS